jgi:hypothetical protein
MQCFSDSAPDTKYLIQRPISESLRAEAVKLLRPVEELCLSLGLVVTAETVRELVDELETDRKSASLRPAIG